MGSMRKASFVSTTIAVLLATTVVAPAPATADRFGERTPGTLDPTFGQDGVVVTDLGAMDVGDAVAVGPRLVAAGTVQTGFCCDWQLDVALVGYLFDGTVDPDFGDAGVVMADLDQIDRPVDVQLDAEGRVLVLMSVGDSTDTRGAALARYLADGTPDVSFGEGGLVDVGTDLYPSRVIVQSNGKIVVTARDPIVVSRYLPDGHPDPAFGDEGRVVTSLGTPNDWPIGLAALSDGKLLVIARTALLRGDFEGDFHLALVRYRAGGSLDRSFGSDGVIRRRIRDWSDVIDGEVSTDGKIVVLVSAGGGSSYCGPPYSGQTLWRFRRDGRPDRTFDGNGRARVTTMNSRAIALQARGHLVVLGEGCHAPDLESGLAFALARYRADGSLDPRFGDNGTTVSQIGDGSAVPHGLVLQPDGRALVVGNTLEADGFSVGDLVVARYVIS